MDMLDGSRKGTHDRRESMRPASVSSSDLSDVSSLNRRRKSSAPKVAAVVIASLAIVAVLVGVTVYLIDMEREKQEIERAERIEEGIETEVEFAEAANAFIADEMEEVEDEVLQRMEAEKTRRERIKTLSQRRRFLENFQHRFHIFVKIEKMNDGIPEHKYGLITLTDVTPGKRISCVPAQMRMPSSPAWWPAGELRWSRQRGR